jgi:trehalose 6-phosphate synthase/phosphatase
MLGADLIGFHTSAYRDNFLDTVEREFGSHITTSAATATIEIGGRQVQTGVFPVGIDSAAFGTESAPREAIIQTLDLRASTRRILLGIDRLDYTKGIIRRLLAYRRVLARYPAWREHIQLIQVAVPSRGGVAAYRRFRQEVEGVIARINGEFSTPGWTPIRYLHQSLSRDMVIALYRAADLMLVTPLRDGMNLVAKEFVASRTDGDGVLILSEFAGAAAELGDALIVNPYDVAGVERAISMGLTMSRADRRMRMARLRAQIAEYDVHRWADAFLSALDEAVAFRNPMAEFASPIGLAVAEA